MNYKTKNTLKQILSVALAGLATFGAIFGLVKLSEVLKEETKVIHPTFSVGGLNANGEYEETDGSIYTKDSFECLGMSVKLDFDSNVSYQAFYYDDLDKYISSSPVYEESMELAVPATAVYARLEVTPIWADDVEEEDQVVHWYNVAEYADQLEISVLKNQEKLHSVALFEGLANYDFASMTKNEDYLYLNIGYLPVCYANNYFEGETITKIRVPVMEIEDPTAENVFTVSVAEVSDDFKTVKIIKNHVLKLEPNRFSGYSVMEWADFDVNIKVGKGQTLMFGSATDTITPCRDGNLNESGSWYNNVGAENSTLVTEASLLFDIYVLED